MYNIRYIRFNADTVTIERTKTVIKCLRAIKNRNNLVMFDEYVEQLKILVGDACLSYFVPLTTAEIAYAEDESGSDFNDLMNYGGVPKRYFESLVSNLLMGDYDILDIENMDANYKLSVSVYGIPYGGLEGLIIMLECLGNDVVAYRQGSDEIIYNGIRWDWWA